MSARRPLPEDIIASFSRVIKKQGSLDLSTLEKLEDFARFLSGRIQTSSILCVSGPMGVGKTTLIKMLVAQWGTDEALSPSFALENVYQGNDIDVHHFDLDRLQDGDDIESTGFWDVFARRPPPPGRKVVVVEWPERLPKDSLPTAWPLWVVALDQDRQGLWALL
jgi:tRNA threonylcarbamoyladenosine biosynthesis protein TsaE